MQGTKRRRLPPICCPARTPSSLRRDSRWANLETFFQIDSVTWTRDGQSVVFDGASVVSRTLCGCELTPFGGPSPSRSRGWALIRRRRHSTETVLGFARVDRNIDIYSFGFEQPARAVDHLVLPGLCTGAVSRRRASRVQYGPLGRRCGDLGRGRGRLASETTPPGPQQISGLSTMVARRKAHCFRFAGRRWALASVDRRQ